MKIFGYVDEKAERAAMRRPVTLTELLVIAAFLLAQVVCIIALR